MPGTNPLFIENTINRHGANAKGIVGTIPVPDLGTWLETQTTGESLAKLFGAPPGNTAGAFPITNFGGVWEIGWQGTADETHTITTAIELDECFCEDPKKFVWPILVRRVGAGTDNTDLAITCLVQALVPGDTTFRTIIAAASNKYTPAAKVATVTHGQWDMDILSGASATVKGYLQPGTILSFTFAPNEACGTNLGIYMIPKKPIVRQHLVVASESDRKPLFV